MHAIPWNVIDVGIPILYNIIKVDVAGLFNVDYDA